MKPAFRCLTILATGGLLVACGEPVSPPGTPARPPATSIHDGAHGGGNPGFFFLPPLVSNPSGNSEYRDAAFAVVSPVVRICKLAADPSLGPTTCASEVISFSGAQIQASVTNRQYSVNWDTKATNLSTSSFYRMTVFVGTQMLGFADVDPVTPQEMRNPKSGETITLLDGRTLPIKFTIEEDGLCVGAGECTIVRITDDGGSFVLPSGNGGIYLPTGWLPEGISEVSMKLQRVATGEDNDCLEEGHTGPGLIRQYEGCMEITTDPDLATAGGIRQPGVVGLCTEIASTHPDYHYIQMIKSDAGRPIVPLDDANPSVIVGFTCNGFAGTPEVIGSLPGPLQQLAHAAWRRLSNIELVRTAHAIDLGASGELDIGMDFSHFTWGIRGGLSAVSSATTSVPLNEDAALSVRVLANHLHNGAPSQNAGLQDIPVTFTITSGTGALLGDGEIFSAGPVTVVSGETGLADVFLRTGATAGVYTVQATADGVTAPITFTVNSGVFSIDFETLPGAEGPCSPCSLSSQYSPNAQFAYLPFGGPAATVLPAARVAGGPYHAVTNHSATAPATTEGGFGILRMTLGGDPTRTTFKVRYSGIGTTPDFTVYGWDPIEGVPVLVQGAATYTVADVMSPAGTPILEASVTVSVSTGIYRIDIGTGTGTEAIYLDDITITGAVFPQIN
jgi:hypothetical protein